MPFQFCLFRVNLSYIFRFLFHRYTGLSLIQQKTEKRLIFCPFKNNYCNKCIKRRLEHRFAAVMFSKLIWISNNKLPSDKALSTSSKLSCADQVTLLSTLKWYLLFLFLQKVVVKSSSKYSFQSRNWFIVVSEIKKSIIYFLIIACRN